MCVPYKLNLQEIHKRSEDNKGGGEGKVKEAQCVYPTSRIYKRFLSAAKTTKGEVKGSCAS